MATKTKKTPAKTKKEKIMKVVTPPVAVERLTPALKEYITTNFQKLPLSKVAENTGLTEQEILDYVQGGSDALKPTKMKMKYGSVKGESVIFDESRSMAADRQATKEPAKSVFNNDVVPIVFKQGFEQQ